MGSAYPELKVAAETVSEQLLLEEQRFAKTLSAGLAILDDEVRQLDDKTIPGDVVFRLYDTYGFPADLTADIARERELIVDMDGFESNMEQQRQRARAASNFAKVGINLQTDVETEFLGYDNAVSDARVVELYVDAKSVQSIDDGQEALVVLDRTPFYGCLLYTSPSPRDRG